jgi:hypothetical protein
MDPRSIQNLNEILGHFSPKTRLFSRAVFLALLASSGTAQAETILNPVEPRFVVSDFTRVGLSGGLLSSSTNFGPGGDAVLFDSANVSEYSRKFALITLDVPLADRFSVFGSFLIQSVESTHPLSGTQSGLGDQSVGATYRAFESEKGHAFDLQVRGDFAPYQNTSVAPQIPLLGDGTFDTTLTAWFRLPLQGLGLKEWNAWFGAGYQIRSQGFSASVPWTAEIRKEAPYTKGFLGGLGVFGMQSLETDTRTVPVVIPFDWAGGSYAIGAYNPSLVQGRLRIGYRFNENIIASARAQMPIYGINAAKAWIFAAGAEWNFGPRSKSGPESTAQRTNRGNFQSYTLDATVTNMNDRLYLIKIDKGEEDGVAVGQRFDIFTRTEAGRPGEAVARAKVSNIRGNESVLEIEEYYREIWIEEGFLARRRSETPRN